jgi:hypothetical protein
VTVTDAFRPEISFDYFIQKDNLSVWDININLHYLFHMKYGIYIYPILGATFQHTHSSVDMPKLDANGIPAVVFGKAYYEGKIRSEELGIRN